MFVVRLGFIVCFLNSVFATDFTAPLKQDKEEKQTVRRVKRPVFSVKDTDGVFFKDVFEQGLVGPRPEPTELSTTGKSSVAATENADKESDDAWSRFIDRDSIEDEIKLLHRQLQASVTTPSRFNSQFREVRQHFSMLSLLFAIVREYDQEIRWKKYAADAQVAFAEGSVKARTASKPAFENSRQRMQDLDELVRGGAIPVNENLSGQIQWPEVIDRRAIMVRLEEAVQDSLKPAAATPEDFKKQIDEMTRQAAIVSALAHALIQEGMDESDDEGYRGFAKAMGTAARDILTDVKQDDFESASLGVNAISQSCADCHGEWR